MLTALLVAVALVGPTAPRVPAPPGSDADHGVSHKQGRRASAVRFPLYASSSPGLAREANGQNQSHFSVYTLKDPVPCKTGLDFLLAGPAQGPPAPTSPAPPGTTTTRAPKPIHWGFYAFSIGGQCADGISTKRFLARGWHETTAGFGWAEDHPNVAIAMKCTMGYLFARFGDWLHTVGVRNNWREVRWLGKAVPVAAGFFGFKVAIHNERLR